MKNIKSNVYPTGGDYPDLIVRTGGYKRLSNFMLWQSAYSELIFFDILWPEFILRVISRIFLVITNQLKESFEKVDNDFEFVKRLLTMLVL